MTPKTHKEVVNEFGLISTILDLALYDNIVKATLDVMVKNYMTENNMEMRNFSVTNFIRDNKDVLTKNLILNLSDERQHMLRRKI